MIGYSGLQPPFSPGVLRPFLGPMSIIVSVRGRWEDVAVLAHGCIREAESDWFSKIAGSDARTTLDEDAKPFIADQCLVIKLLGMCELCVCRCEPISPGGDSVRLEFELPASSRFETSEWAVLHQRLLDADFGLELDDAVATYFLGDKDAHQSVLNDMEEPARAVFLNPLPETRGAWLWPFNHGFLSMVFDSLLSSGEVIEFDAPHWIEVGRAVEQEFI